MTYEDIVDWSDDTHDPQDFDTFEDWLEKITDDFANQNHYFPPETIDELRQHWNETQKDDVSKDDIEELRQDAQSTATDFLIESAEKEIRKTERRRLPDAVDIAPVRKQITVVKKNRTRHKQLVKELKQNRQEMLRNTKVLQRQIKKTRAEKSRLKRERRKAKHA